jgi:TonB family protein
MNRLQKKCFIASTSLHLMLALVFVVCSAFLSSNSGSKPENVQIINFVPVMTTDLPVAPNPGASAAPATPVPTPPVPTPPVPTPPAQPVPNTPAVEPVRERTHPVVPDFTRAGSKPTTPPKPKPAASTENSDQAARQRVLDQIRRAQQAIGSSMSGSTRIELSGAGTTGVPYSNWLSAIVSIYQHSWQMPAGITQDFPPVRTSITIARDGSVISKRMTGSSGIPEVDASIQETLERITQTVPLPEGAKESERTVIINFNKDKSG